MILFLFPRSLQERFKHRKPLVWLMDLTLLWAIVAIAFIISFRFAEKAEWGEAAWQMWQTTTTIGYGNAPAQTCIGRWLVAILGTTSLALLPSIIAAVFDIVNDKKTKRRIGLLDNPYEDACVVFNLPETTLFKMFAQELRLAQKDIPICIVDNRIEELPPSIAAMHNVHFIRGSLLDQSTYIRAKIKKNKAIFIFPLDDDNPDSDGTTRSIIDCVEEFVGNNTRILYVLVSEANAWMFEHFKNATAIHESLRMRTLVHEFQGPFTAITIQTLLSNKKGANPATVAPKYCVGWSWKELQDRTIHVSHELDTQVNLFALIRNGEPELCPDTHEQIKQGDLLSIICHKGFDWAEFEKAMFDDATALV